ncbi:class I SAM-dependent methyltransferase [Paenibacillus thailandensis]|uniref:Class I SAM-dependent methyltransferase n=1 Tax=Paenibacillus thailandensis TaxID=393250 RepID=A0ABW5QRE1_9BACL
MLIDRIARIREAERRYHDDCYENEVLFQEGSWLHKPVKTVMELFDQTVPRNDMRLLDLGCGVGRNSIPLALKLLGSGGKIVCVDLLESAIRHLSGYSRQYGVSTMLETHIADIGAFPIEPGQYDYIYSVSALEHLDSAATFDRVLTDMIEGTREQGIHCLIISSNISETEPATGERLEPMFELLMDTETLNGLLYSKYDGWRVIKHTVKPYETEIAREGKPVRLRGDVVTWAAQKV